MTRLARIALVATFFRSTCYSVTAGCISAGQEIIDFMAAAALSYILSQFSPVYNFNLIFHFNIILPVRPTFYRLSLALKFSDSRFRRFRFPMRAIFPTYYSLFGLIIITTYCQLNNVSHESSNFFIFCSLFHREDFGKISITIQIFLFFL